MPLMIRVLISIYGFVAPYIGKDSTIRKWVSNNKVITSLFVTMILQLAIIIIEADQLYESNRQIVKRNEEIHELELSVEHLTDKNKVLTTVLDRLATGPLDDIKSTETVPLPETEIKQPVETPKKPKPEREDPYVRGRRNEDISMEGLE